MIINRYKIAGLAVELRLHHPDGRLLRQTIPYSCGFPGKPDITIQISEERSAIELEQNPHLTPSELEYILTGIDFFAHIIRFNGLGLHSSAVVLDGEAYLFSANSGVGKSTHTQLWRKLFGEERTFILNDDKPVLRFVGGTWFAYGTPWSGKSDLNSPQQIPLKAIAFLERSSTNQIRRMNPEESVFPFLEQTLRPSGKEAMAKTLDHLTALLTQVPTYILRCRPDLEAAQTAYNTMKGFQ